MQLNRKYIYIKLLLAYSFTVSILILYTIRDPYFYLIIVRLLCKLVCFVHYLLCFAAYSLIALYKRSRVQIPYGPGSNFELTLCQPSCCWVYFSKQGGFNSVKSEKGASLFICHDQGTVSF